MRLTPRLLLGVAFMLLLPCVVSMLAFYELASATPVTPTPVLSRTSDAAAGVLNTEAVAEQLYLNGLAAYQSGDYSGATTSFQEAIRISPGNANWHNNLGLALAAVV